MSFKDENAQKKYMEEYYSKNKEKIKAANLSRREEIKGVVRKIKEEAGCVDCKNKFPYYVLDFDHRDGSEKEINVARMTKSLKSLPKILVEIAKCDVVCSNCHRTRTYKRSLAHSSNG